MTPEVLKAKPRALLSMVEDELKWAFAPQCMEAVTGFVGRTGRQGLFLVRGHPWAVGLGSWRKEAPGGK